MRAEEPIIIHVKIRNKQNSNCILNLHSRDPHITTTTTTTTTNNNNNNNTATNRKVAGSIPDEVNV
jgi:hypothetical protein